LIVAGEEVLSKDQGEGGVGRDGTKRVVVASYDCGEEGGAEVGHKHVVFGVLEEEEAGHEEGGTKERHGTIRIAVFFAKTLYVLTLDAFFLLCVCESVEIALPYSIHPLPASVTSTSPSEVPTSSLSAFFADLLCSSAIPKEGSYNLILDRATVTIVRRSKEDVKLGGGLALIR
jgi:hypothetical protein